MITYILVGIGVVICLVLFYSKRIELKTFLLSLGVLVAYAALSGRTHKVKQKIKRKIKISNPLATQTKKQLAELEKQIKHDEILTKHHLKEIRWEIEEQKKKINAMDFKELCVEFNKTFRSK